MVMTRRCPSCLSTLESGASRCAACGTTFTTAESRARARRATIAAIGGVALVGLVTLLVSVVDGEAHQTAVPARDADPPRELDGAHGAARGEARDDPHDEPAVATPPGGAPRPAGRERLDGAGPGAGSAAAGDPEPAAPAATACDALVLRSFDAQGREVRRIAGHVVAAQQRSWWVVPLRALAGAHELRPVGAGAGATAPRAEPAGVALDGDDLAFVPLRDAAPGRPAAGSPREAAVAPWEELAPGVRLHALDDSGRAEEPAVARVVERIDGERLLVVACASDLGERFLVDARGRLAGLVREGGGGRAVVVTLAGALQRLPRARPIDLATLDSARFEQDGGAQRALATWYAAGGHYEAALERYLAAVALDPGLRDPLVRPVTAVVELALREARARDALDAALPLLERAATLFPREPRILHACGLALLDEGEPEAALRCFADAVRIAGAGDGPLVTALHAAYLHSGETARAERRALDAIALLEEGLARFREDAQLLHSLGFAYFEAGDRDRARIVLEKVASLEPQRASELAPLLATLAPAAAPSGRAVEIPFARGGGAIRAGARFDDREEALAIVDTGASLTAISEGLAARLRLDRRHAQRTISIMTASGRIDGAPVFVLGSVDLAGARVTNVEVVVAPLPDGGAEALVGLNFLEHFDVSLDSRRGVLRLAAR